MLKARLGQGRDPDLYFWRDSGGTEVDVVYEDGQKVMAIEIKSGKIFSPELVELILEIDFAPRPSGRSAAIP
jgi:predicted AAA+ superfamily ATPase